MRKRATHFMRIPVTTLFVGSLRIPPTALFAGSVRQATKVLFTSVVLAFLVAIVAPWAAAQTPLSSGVCVDHVGVPSHYSFNQTSVPYWAVVGVAPGASDDKDIYLYSGPAQTGSLLASSTGVTGSDFIVADFNHASYGTYYPTVTYGSISMPYTVEWYQGGKVLPLNQTMSVPIGGPGAACYAFDVWDVYLEAGATYRLLSLRSDAAVRFALFRNTGTGAYFAGRSQAVLELFGHTVWADYTAPATDWYGLVVFPNQRYTSSYWADFELRKLDSCEPLAAANCVSAVPYGISNGPADSYYFQQSHNWWSAVAVAPSPGDEKSLRIRSQCDYPAASAPLAESAPGVGQTALVVGDFNYVTPLPVTRFVDLDRGSPYAQYTIEWDNGNDYFFANSGLSGAVGGTSGDCGLVKIWDISLLTGKTYRVDFVEGGAADIRFALFGSPGSAAYYAGRHQAIWELTGPGTLFGAVPRNGYFGLAMYANKRGENGSYTVSLEEMNDCGNIPTGTCVAAQGNVKDFFMGATVNNYWLAVGVLPADGDDKDIAVYSQCDGEGTLFASSPGIEGADFVVADCNHPPASVSVASPSSPGSLEPLANNWYPRVTYGSASAAYTVSCDLGNEISEDLFPHDVVVQGEIGGTTGECGMLKIWDIYLQQGVQYHIGFTRGGEADARLALFRNPTSNRIWAGRAGREWELDGPQNYEYTAPATDYYGLVVFANRRAKLGSYAIRFSSGTTGIDPEPALPDRYALYQNTPNPFNPTTEIRYDVPSGGGRVSLRIYDVHGRLVRTLAEGDEAGGPKTIIWDARDDRGMTVATGVYFYRLEAPGFSETRKTVVMK